MQNYIDLIQNFGILALKLYMLLNKTGEMAIIG
jgi:hypothetical protein